MNKGLWLILDSWSIGLIKTFDRLDCSTLYLLVIVVSNFVLKSMIRPTMLWNKESNFYDFVYFSKKGCTFCSTWSVLSNCPCKHRVLPHQRYLCQYIIDYTCSRSYLWGSMLNRPLIFRLNHFENSWKGISHQMHRFLLSAPLSKIVTNNLGLHL